MKERTNNIARLSHVSSNVKTLPNSGRLLCGKCEFIDFKRISQLVEHQKECAGQHKCPKCGLADHIKRACRSGKICRRCGGLGHTASGCVQYPCNRCKETGTPSIYCFSPKRKRPRKDPSSKTTEKTEINKPEINRSQDYGSNNCIHCNGEDHVARYCRPGKICRSCGKEGHYARGCLICAVCSKIGHNADDCTQIEEHKKKLADNKKAPTNRNLKTSFKSAADEELENDIAMLIEQGLDAEKAQVVALVLADRKLDALTGFFGKRTRDKTLDMAVEYASKRRAQIFYIEFDIANLGGMNDYLSHVQADEHFKALANLSRDCLADVPGVVEFYRHGGDEFCAIIKSDEHDAKKLQELLCELRAKVSEYTKEKELDNIPHPKHPGQKEFYGVGLNIGITQIMSGDTPDAVHERADKGVRADKSGAVET